MAGRIPTLVPENQFPMQALQQSVQEFPKDENSGGMVWTWNVATAADQITQWGRNVYGRDRQLRDFWPTEPYLAGALTNVVFRNSVFEWEIKGGSAKVNQAVADTLVSAIAGDSFGWVPFIEKFSQDLYSQDNGAFIELIRDPGTDANSRFKGPLAPVLGIGHLDSNRCHRTGNPDYPVVYMDRNGGKHKLRWYEVIPFADHPSAIETMNGVGYCAVTRVLRMAQIARSLAIFKDEKISGRHFKQIHFVSGVSRQEIKDEMKRGQEEANNSGLIRFIMPAIMASLDPEKPVSTASIDLASLPDGFSFDEDMKWYISSLALGFGVDYQEFAPLPGGNLGSSQQSVVLHRKSSGKGPAVFMRLIADAFRNYGVLPRGCQMRFNDKDEQEELERQTVRSKALEEYAIAIRNFVLTPEAARADLVRRGIYDDATIEGIPEQYGLAQMAGGGKGGTNPVGQTGGNTMVEDINRNETGAGNESIGDRLRKAYETYTTSLREMRQENHEQALAITIAKALGLAMNGLRKEQPNIIVNVPEQPRPVVNVNVKMPKITSEVQRIIRDERGNMEYTTTERTYEE